MYIGLVAIGISLALILCDAITNDLGSFLALFEALMKKDTATVEMIVMQNLYAFSHYLENPVLLKDLFWKFLGDVPFVKVLVEWGQSGWKVFHPNGYDLFQDFAKSCFLFVTTDVIVSPLSKAITFQRPDDFYDRLCARIGNVVNSFGLSLLIATISLLLFHAFSGWWYGIWGDTLLSNLAILGMLILLS